VATAEHTAKPALDLERLVHGLAVDLDAVVSFLADAVMPRWASSPAVRELRAVAPV
jgi:hypothetical protein